jgi:GMP synthase PP-ATPase subunit
MMRDRCESVVVGLPTGVSSDFAGKLVQVQFGDGKVVLFVKDEICRTAEFGKK